jgi:hypothetical protein
MIKSVLNVSNAVHNPHARAILATCAKSDFVSSGEAALCEPGLRARLALQWCAWGKSGSPTAGREVELRLGDRGWIDKDTVP